MTEQLFARVKVIIEREYLVPLADVPLGSVITGDSVSALDGRTLREVADEWFIDYPLDTHHETRDGHMVVGASRFLGTRLEEMTDDD